MPGRLTERQLSRTAICFGALLCVVRKLGSSHEQLAFASGAGARPIPVEPKLCPRAESRRRLRWIAPAEPKLRPCAKDRRSLRWIAAAASRRELLLGSGTTYLSNADARQPLCEMPLHRLKPVAGQGSPVELMLDSGLSEGLVTPALAQKLHLRRVGSTEGEAAGGSAKVDLVELSELTLDCGMKLENITAAVSDFPQAFADKGLPLKGMLGYRSLMQYDTDIDFKRGVFRLWRAGDGVAAARASGMGEVEGVLLPEFGILSVRVMVPGGNGRAAALGVVDTGAAFSAVNEAAARALSLDSAKGNGEIIALGVDGKPLKLPVARDVVLPLGGAARASGGWEEAANLKADTVAVGELPALKMLTGDGRPSVLLGLDVLAKGRLMFAANSQNRKQLLFVGSS